MSWLDRLEEAERNGYFQDTDLSDINNYDTCVVGEMLPELVAGDKFWWSKGPIEHSLFLTGSEIASAMENEDFEGVRLLYYEIKSLAKRYRKEVLKEKD